jgi:hypothetical protein
MFLLREPELVQRTFFLSGIRTLERDEIWSNRHRAPSLWFGMIFSENRYTLFRIML